LSDLLNERVYDPNGEKRGGTKTRWLVFRLDPKNDNKCTEYQFVDEPPQSLDEDQYIEQMEFRTTVCRLPDGTQKTVNYVFHLNEKDDEEIYLKTLRRPEQEELVLPRDLHRGMYMFESDEDAELVFEEKKRRIQNPDSEGQQSYDISIEKEKSGVGGSKDNPAIPCIKSNWVIDGNKDYEFQAYTPMDYINYNCWKPYAHTTHKVKRFFNNSLCETFFPKAYFPSIDKEKIANDAIDRLHAEELASRKILPVVAPSANDDKQADKTERGRVGQVVFSQPQVQQKDKLEQMTA
jgi:hypothetical protein